jgi:hypothetical protein
VDNPDAVLESIIRGGVFASLRSNVAHIAVAIAVAIASAIASAFRRLLSPSYVATIGPAA